jgi:hypothetical protein
MSTSPPEPTPEEEEAPLERHASELRMTRRCPTHDDLERVVDPDEDA